MRFLYLYPILALLMPGLLLAQPSSQKWNISASYGEQRVKMTRINDQLVNAYMAPYPPANSNVSSNSILTISAGRALNNLFGLNVSYSRTGYHSKSYYTFVGHYHTDSVDFIADMGSVGTLDIKSNMVSVKPYFALHRFLGTDSVFIYRNFRLYLMAELGYGWSELRLAFNHDQPEAITDLSNFPDLDMKASGFFAAPSLRLEYLMTQGKGYGILLGLEGGYRYFETANVHGSGVHQWAQLNMDFTGWYWMPGLKLSF